MKRAAKKTGIVVLLLAAGPWSAPLPAHAAPRAEGMEVRSAAIADAARARFNEGLRFYAKKKYNQALASFLQAYALTKVPAILVNLGQTSLRAGRPLDAARYFRRYLREATEITPPQKARAEKGIVEARTKLGSIVVVASEGADILVDGELVGRAPLDGPVDVLPGAHDVRMSTADGPKGQSVRVVRGVEVTVKLVASGATPPAPARSNEEPVEASETPPATEEHAEEQAPAPVTESPGFFSPPASMAPVYVAGSVAVIALTTAIVLGGIRLNADRNQSTATDALTRNGHDPSACATAPVNDPTIGGSCATLLDSLQTLQQTSAPHVGALIVGSGAAVFALGWYFLASKTSSPAPSVGLVHHPLRVAPAPGPGTAGAGVRVEF